ncbi:CidA/LrgA family protein [Peribacillus glennii]|uniref:CidA/LrgA family protein n=1 Tax=Peribacillus glennii TaxID=2303991 RepID=A0A372LJL7_9BACI|nr:CidA/LrgA family protein [Peribacillus glennii]RFU66647.1 CidA/LrgA family protein [Peribacillus glennii]
MPWIIQLCIITGFLLLGKFFGTIFHLPIPGSVIGMILLLGALIAGLAKLEWVEKAAAFQIKHLTLLFVPLVIGLFLSPNLIPLFDWSFIAALIVSSLCCLLGTAFSVEWFEKRKRRIHK